MRLSANVPQSSTPDAMTMPTGRTNSHALFTIAVKAGMRFFQKNATSRATPVYSLTDSDRRVNDDAVWPNAFTTGAHVLDGCVRHPPDGRLVARHRFRHAGIARRGRLHRIAHGDAREGAEAEPPVEHREEGEQTHRRGEGRRQVGQ